MSRVPSSLVKKETSPTYDTAQPCYNRGGVKLCLRPYVEACGVVVFEKSEKSVGVVCLHSLQWPIRSSPMSSVNLQSAAVASVDEG